jgi:NhaP-type Na+/H+ or K+/H+ antiporter
VDTYIVILTLMGLAFLGAAWLPRLVDDAPLSFPVLYVLVGIILFILPLNSILPNPLESSVFTERFTELIVIVALTGAGLKLSRPVRWKGWALTWRLLTIGMPLCIATVAVLGWWALGLAPASAVLLRAVLAPTDPVLASDVQVGAPHEEKEGEVRFALTSEAGLNNGLAFPFTNLAIAMAAAGAGTGAWLLEWFLVDILYKLLVGTLAGMGIGYMLAYLFFRVAASHTRSARDGFVVLAVTFLAYGVTEILHGYGFLAVFLAALVMRQFERNHSYHEELHDFSEGFERLLMTLMLFLFGGLIAGGLLSLTIPLTQSS